MVLAKGALIDYGTDFMGPILNVVIFQFNPESLTRTIVIPDRSPQNNKKEKDQAGSPPTENISFTAYFNAAESINNEDSFSMEFGISSQLAALEKLIYPPEILSKEIGEIVDTIGEILTCEDFQLPIPRFKIPRILFIWGKSRILPVTIESMTIKETHYNSNLNPIEAEVDLSLAVHSYESTEGDEIARGALKYTTMIKDSIATANLKNTSTELKEFIPF